MFNIGVQTFAVKGFLIAILFLLTLTEGVAQNPVDSLRQLIDETDDQRLKIDLENALAYELFDVSLEESLKASKRSFRLSRSIQYGKGEGWSLIYQSIYYLLSGQPDIAINHDLQALAIGNKISDDNIVAYSYLQLGKAFRDIGLLDSAFFYYKKAEPIELKTGNIFALRQTYSAISKYFLYESNPKEAIVFAEKALEYALQLNDKQHQAYAWLDIGDAHRDNYDFKKARECYEKAFEIGKSRDWVVTDYYESYAHLQMLEGDFDKAFDSFVLVMKAYNSYQGKHALARTLIRMGEVMQEKGLFNVASDHLYKALKISEESGYKFLMAEAYYGLAWVHYRANQFQTARGDIRKAINQYQALNNRLRYGGCLNVLGLIYMKLKNFDSSLYYHKAGLLERKNSNNLTSISSSTFNIGELYLDFNKPREALPYFLEGEKIDSAINDKYGLGMYKDRLGRIYWKLNDYNKAETYLNAALELAKQSASLDVLGATYNDLSMLNEKRGNLKEALEYKKLYEANYDSIYTRGAAQSMASYRTLYNINQKDQQIELLNKDKKIQNDELRFRNIIIYGVIGIALALAISLYVFYHYSIRLKKLSQEVHEKNEEIQTQSEELMESNTALTKLNEEITNQREEIKQQAEELQVSNESIAKINEGLEKTVEKRTADLRTAYQELDTFFYRSSHDFRRPLTTLMGLSEVAKLSVKERSAMELFEKVSITAHNLDKMLVKLQSISDVGSGQLIFKEVPLRQIIDDKLDEQSEILRSKQIKVSLDIDKGNSFVSYPALVKIIVDNLIENAIVFASPISPYIIIKAFKQQSNEISIEIEDNGEGIKPEIKDQLFEMFFRGSERSQGNGLGLYIAKKATERLSGTISFSNNENGGATFKVVLPSNG